MENYIVAIRTKDGSLVDTIPHHSFPIFRFPFEENRRADSLCTGAWHFAFFSAYDDSHLRSK